MPLAQYQNIGLKAVLNQFLKDSGIYIDPTLREPFFPGKEDGVPLEKGIRESYENSIFTPLLRTALEQGRYKKGRYQKEGPGFLYPSFNYSLPQMIFQPARDPIHRSSNSLILLDYCKHLRRGNESGRCPSRFYEALDIVKEERHEKGSFVSPLFSVTHRKRDYDTPILELLFESSVDSLADHARILGRIDQQLNELAGFKPTS